jgi:hypothetical protein
MQDCRFSVPTSDSPLPLILRANLKPTITVAEQMTVANLTQFHLAKELSEVH